MCVRSHIHISCDSFCFQIQSIIFLVGVVFSMTFPMFVIQCLLFSYSFIHFVSLSPCHSAQYTHLLIPFVLSRVHFSAHFSQALANSVRSSFSFSNRFDSRSLFELLRRHRRCCCCCCCTAYNIFFIVLTFFELHWIGITGLDVHAYDWMKYCEHGVSHIAFTHTMNWNRRNKDAKSEREKSKTHAHSICINTLSHVVSFIRLIRRQLDRRYTTREIVYVIRILMRCCSLYSVFP